MATFPVYAEIKIEGFSEKRESALLRSEMESGPPRQARVKSRVMVTRNIKIRLKTLADYQAFLSWFSVDVDEGAGWFNWPDPVTGRVMSARFSSSGINATPVSGVHGVWIVEATIETWGN